MTIDPDIKRWFVRTYDSSGAFTNRMTEFEKSKFKVIVADIMELLKAWPDYVTTVEEMMDHFVRAICMNMEQMDPFTKEVYVVCLDQGSPWVKKLLAHCKRHKGVQPLDPGNQLIIPDTGPLPMPLKAQIIANRDLIQRELYPLVWRSILEKVNLPHVGQFVILQGCPSPYPVHPQNRDIMRWGQVMYKENRKLVDTRTNSVCSGGVVTGVSARLKNMIQEADDAVVFYTLMYAREGLGHDVWVYMNDGDAILLLLANSPCRLDPNTLQWKNQVILELKGHPTKPGKLKRSRSGESNAWLRDGGTLYVRINKLYDSIINDERLLRAGVQNPVISVLTLMILAGTDYFSSFGPNREYRLFYGFATHKYVTETFYRYTSRFSHMIQLSYGGSLGFGDHKTFREPYIDEYAFYEFCLQCYALAYKDKIPEEKMSEKALRDYLERPLKTMKPRRRAETLEEMEARKSRMRKGKKETQMEFNARRASTTPIPEETEKEFEKRLNRRKHKRLPPKRLFRYWARMLEYNWVRILNAHRPNSDSIIAPCREGDDGRPYFPYIRDPNDPNRVIIYDGPLSHPRKPPMPYKPFIRARVMGKI